MKWIARVVCLARLLCASNGQKTCGPSCFGSKANQVCSSQRDCFFSDCTCEYRGYVSGCTASNGACASWRTTDSCNANGPRKPQDDLSCCEYVPTGWSGYCECFGGNKVKMMGCGGRSNNFYCQSECAKAGYANCVGSWSDWSACSSSCIGGTRTRTYSLPTGTPSCPVETTTADGATETESCNSDQPCGIDCVGSWSSCDKTCQRQYTQEVAPLHGGAACAPNPGCVNRQDDCIKGEVVHASLTLQKDISEIAEGSRARTTFENVFKQDVATRLGIAPNRITITEIFAGSIVVTFSIAPASGSGVSMSVSDVKTAFSAPGVLIASVNTTAPVSSVYSLAPDPPSSSTDADGGDSDGMGAGIIIVIVLGSVVFCVSCYWLNFVYWRGYFSERQRGDRAYKKRMHEETKIALQAQARERERAKCYKGTQSFKDLNDLRAEVARLQDHIKENKVAPSSVVVQGVPIAHPDTVTDNHPFYDPNAPPGFSAPAPNPSAPPAADVVPPGFGDRPPAYVTGCSPGHDAAYKHAQTLGMGDTEAKVYATSPQLGFTATVPSNFPPGSDVLHVQTSAGNQVAVAVPANAKAGQQIHGVDTKAFVNNIPANFAPPPSSGPPGFPGPSSGPPGVEAAEAAEAAAATAKASSGPPGFPGPSSGPPGVEAAEAVAAAAAAKASSGPPGFPGPSSGPPGFP